MRHIRIRIIQLSQYFTEVIHIIATAVLGTLLPDADHLIGMFWYNRESDYSKNAVKHLKKCQIAKFIRFNMIYHKTNNQLYFHNIASLFLAICLALFCAVQKRPLLFVFFAAWSLHYIWDIIEDIICLNGVNPHWVFRFKDKAKGQVKN